MLTLQETQYVHDSMNRLKIELITYIYILYYQSVIIFQLTWLVFPIFELNFIALIYLMYFVIISIQKINNIYFRNKFNFWSFHGIMNTSGLSQSK